MHIGGVSCNGGRIVGDVSVAIVRIATPTVTVKGYPKMAKLRDKYSQPPDGN